MAHCDEAIRRGCSAGIDAVQIRQHPGFSPYPMVGSGRDRLMAGRIGGRF